VLLSRFTAAGTDLFCRIAVFIGLFLIVFFISLAVCSTRSVVSWFFLLFVCPLEHEAGHAMNAVATKKVHLLIWEHAANCTEVCAFVCIHWCWCCVITKL